MTTWIVGTMAMLVMVVTIIRFRILVVEQLMRLTTKIVSLIGKLFRWLWKLVISMTIGGDAMQRILRFAWIATGALVVGAVLVFYHAMRARPLSLPSEFPISQKTVLWIVGIIAGVSLIFLMSRVSSWPKLPTIAGKLFWIAAGLAIVYYVYVVFVGNDGVGVLLRQQRQIAAEQHNKNNTPSPSLQVAVCPDAKDFRFSPALGVTKTRIAVRPECWSGWVNTLDWKDWHVQSIENKGLELLFMDERTPVKLEPESTTDQGVRSGYFRLRAPVPGSVEVRVENAWPN